MNSSKPVIIALSGWKRSGKDTVADYLVANFGAKRIGFADPLKNSVAAQFGIDRASIDNPELKEAPLLNMPVQAKDKFSKTVTDFMYGEFRDQNGKRYGEGSPESVMYWTRRALCILEGSSKRSADPDYWVKQAVAQASPGGLYVISDARYINEMESLRREVGANLVTVRINRFETSPSEDPSERDLDNYAFDIVIKNTGTLEQLYDDAGTIIMSVDNQQSQNRTHTV